MRSLRRSWLGSSDIPLEFGKGTKQQQASWAWQLLACLLQGTVKDRSTVGHAEVDPLQGDIWHVTKASAWQGPQSAWPHHLRNSAAQDCVRGWLQDKIKPRGSTSIVVLPQSLLKALRAPADPQDTLQGVSCGCDDHKAWSHLVLLFSCRTCPLRYASCFCLCALQKPGSSAQTLSVQELCPYAGELQLVTHLWNNGLARWCPFNSGEEAESWEHWLSYNLIFRNELHQLISA